MKTAAVIIATAISASSIASVHAAPLPASPVARADTNVCDNVTVGSAKPGNLLAPPQDVTAESDLSTGRLYRVAYATTGPADSVIASCGLVAVPDAADLKGGALNGVVAWAHGTLGVQQKCQPSERPKSFTGPMPKGIGSVTRLGNQSSGALYNMLKDGYAVVATDYPSAGVGGSGLQRYVLGVAAGLAVLDSARTLTGNAQAFGLAAISPNAELPVVTWGHSQGGHSALWAGQLASAYFSHLGDKTLDLAGVAGEAPASQFTTSPGQPQAYMGKHLADRDVYNFDPGLGVKFPIGVAFFSFATVSWSQVQQAISGAFAFGPTPQVDYRQVLTSDGQQSAPQIADLCLSLFNLGPMLKITKPYLNPDETRFFAPPFAGQKAGGSWQGAFDSTCADPGGYAQSVRDWCAWLQFHMPGPYGVNPYSKIPRDNDGKKVPMYLAQGRKDRIIWCVDNNGKVQATDCLTDQLFHSLKDTYCDGTGYLEVDYFPGVTHMSVPNAAATRAGSKDYSGSPLDLFVTGAMKGTLKPMCSADPDAT